jgi:hypothetical protein
VPLEEEAEAAKPPLELWAFVDRLGGLSGRALYFRRILRVRKLPVAIVLDPKEGTEYWSSDSENELVQHLVENGLDPREVERVEAADVSVEDKPIFLHLADDSLLDEFFRVESEQRRLKQTIRVRKWERGEEWIKEYVWLYRLPFKAVKLSVRLGKIVAMEFTEYTGPIEGEKRK